MELAIIPEGFLQAGKSDKPAAPGLGRNRVSYRTSRNYPLALAENRRPSAFHRARIWVRYSHAYPWKNIFAAAHAALIG